AQVLSHDAALTGLNDRRPASKETRTVPKPHIDLAAATQAGERRPGVDLAVVVNGFPRLSETFVLHELLELERRGVRLHLFALRRPDEVVQQDALLELRATVEYLPEGVVRYQRTRVRLAHTALLLQRRLEYVHGLAEVLASPEFSRSLGVSAVLLAHRIV